MIVKGFGIELHLLSSDKIELLREWRNSDFVQQFMQKKVVISAEMQQDWFNSLDKRNNFYFLIRENNEFIGCCNIKNVDGGIGEGGVFVKGPEYLNSISVTKAIFLMYDWAFSNEFIISAKSEILSGNKRAIRFNKMIGFTVNEVGGIVQGSLIKSDFYIQYDKFFKVLNLNE
ncbi:GNAT family N-acetyltransferase [Shewanella indica]|uniref:GNAT family N-acetyltransferase n=1 Tax=Shewanella indica TaxID=768528 RepID=UPI001F25171D|nr:GNAT family N-acetyltransferase [Shewanella indica]MCE9793798.1 GNAT family N-acetyltransferase [Shewanella indica]